MTVDSNKAVTPSANSPAVWHPRRPHLGRHARSREIVLSSPKAKPSRTRHDRRAERGAVCEWHRAVRSTWAGLSPASAGQWHWTLLPAGCSPTCTSDRTLRSGRRRAAGECGPGSAARGSLQRAPASLCRTAPTARRRNARLSGQSDRGAVAAGAATRLWRGPLRRTMMGKPTRRRPTKRGLFTRRASSRGTCQLSRRAAMCVHDCNSTAQVRRRWRISKGCPHATGVQPNTTQW